MVRINHLRNCQLCHALSTSQDDLLRAAVPTPGIALNPGRGFYRGGNPSVRADVTFVRQDFSLTLPVKNAAPWPSEQRFDFVVRHRDARPEELAALEKRSADASYPQREAVIFALKELIRRLPEIRGPVLDPISDVGR
jgi:hypothetical protein